MFSGHNVFPMVSITVGAGKSECQPQSSLPTFYGITSWFVQAKGGLQGISTGFVWFPSHLELRSMVFHRVMALGNIYKQRQTLF